MKAGRYFSAGVLLVLGIATACGVDVGIDGKACPCDTSEGYVCDATRNLCVHPNQLSASSSSGDGGVVVVVQPACDPCQCTGDEDCKDATRPVCGPDKLCVQCTPQNDKCGVGTYCNDKNQCTPGCRDSAACAQLSQLAPLCNTDRHQCVVCLDKTQCPSPQTCTPSGACATACTGPGQCPGGQECCGGLCINVSSDVLNCGKCTNPCTATNGTPKCVNGSCDATCANGFGTCPGVTGVCQTVLRTDANNCGKCGTQCAKLPNVAATSCAAGVCQISKCADGWLNTNNLPGDGCEDPCGQVLNQQCCPGDICSDGLKCANGGGSGGKKCRTQ